MEEPDVIFVICPPVDTNNPPLGLASIYTFLKSKGCKSKVFDFSIDLFNSTYNKNLRSLWCGEKFLTWINENVALEIFDLFKNRIDILVKDLLSCKSKLICFSLNYPNTLFSFEVAKKIKKNDPSRILIFGGSYCFTQEEVKNIPNYELADIFVIGEGEEALFEIINSYKKNKSFEDIEGIFLKKEGHFDFSRFPERRLIENMDILPFPTYEEFDLTAYNTIVLPLLMGRGCVNNCSFCGDCYLTGKYRPRKAEKVFEELQFHIKKNHINTFMFNDLAINSNLKLLEKFCDIIISSNLKINWSGQATVREGMTKELFYKMKKSGCTHISFGLESASNHVLRQMNKKYTPKLAQKVIRLAASEINHVGINLIVGFPGETEKDFKKTFEFVKANKDYIRTVANLNPCYSVHGADMRFNPLKYKIFYPNENIHFNFLKQKYFFWQDDKGNAVKLRKKRLFRMQRLLESINMPYPNCYLVDEYKQQNKEVPELLENLKVSIFVPCYNSERTIRQCLESIFSQKYPIEEVLVIDDGSTDLTVEIASEFSVKIIKNKENKGIGYTRNVGFKNAKNELVASLDSDCVAGEYWLRDLVKHISETVGGVGGRLVEVNKDKLVDKWCSAHMGQNWGNEKVINPEFLFGNNTLYKKSVIKKIGFFNENFKTNYEDTDISKRIKEANFTLIYDPEAEVKHIRSNEFYKTFKRFRLWNLHTTEEPNSLSSLKKQIGHNLAKMRYCFKKDIHEKDYKFIFLDFLVFPILSLLDIGHYFKNDK